MRNSSNINLHAWFVIIGYMDDLLFWFKQFGTWCIETILRIAQNIQIGIIFWNGKMLVQLELLTFICLLIAAKTILIISSL